MRVQVLKPGRRTSWPHAERDEDEFIYIVSGKVDAWNDGHITPMEAGDFIGVDSDPSHPRVQRRVVGQRSHRGER